MMALLLRDVVVITNAIGMALMMMLSLEGGLVETELTKLVGSVDDVPFGKSGSSECVEKERKEGTRVVEIEKGRGGRRRNGKAT